MEADRPAQLIIELLRGGEAVRFRARGGSMWPAVRDGALVELSPCSAAELRAGELAAYRRGGTVVVHRVVRAGNGRLAFAGDALAHSDGAVPADAVLGRARVLSQPRLRLRVPTRQHLSLLLRVARRRLASLRRGGDV